MGFAKKNTKGETAANENEININDNATVELVGKVVDVFEGEKYNYVKIQCNRTKVNPRTNQPYYDEFSVKFDKSIKLPTNEVTATISGYLSSYFNRDIERTQNNITGISIVSN